MKNTASVSIADRQVEEIRNMINIFYIGPKSRQAAVECKETIDIWYPNVKEKNRINEAIKDGSLIKAIDFWAKNHGLVERI